MRIESRTPISNIPASLAAHQLNTTRSGISNAPSSLNMRLNAQENSSGGLCSWISRLIERICRFFSPSSSQETATSGNHSVNSLEERITLGKNYLTAQFEKDVIARNDGQHSAIAVLMTYNGRTIISFGPALRLKSNLDALNQQLRELITSQPVVPDNTELSVNTILCKKNNNNTFATDDFSNSIRFPNTLPVGTFLDSSGGGQGSAPAMTVSEMVQFISTLNCTHPEKQQLAAFLAGL